MMALTPQNAYQTQFAGRIREDEVITFFGKNLTATHTGNHTQLNFQAKEIPQSIVKEFLLDTGVGKRASWREPNFSVNDLNGYNKGT